MQFEHRSTQTILVVDDDEVVRYAVAHGLEGQGFRTMPAADGTQALALAQFASAVVLDVQLPDMYGFEVAKKIRDQRPRVPIVLTSAVFIERPYRTAARFAGAGAFFEKPVDPAALADTLDELLERVGPVGTSGIGETT
jgi:CheY-like chemotaxis protein